jgi:hypothetical protein
MSSDQGQPNANNEDDQITIHKQSNIAISETTYTKEEIRDRRHNRMVKIFVKKFLFKKGCFLNSRDA